jgi:hypothetical protein
VVNTLVAFRALVGGSAPFSRVLIVLGDLKHCVLSHIKVASGENHQITRIEKKILLSISLEQHPGAPQSLRSDNKFKAISKGRIWFPCSFHGCIKYA